MRSTSALATWRAGRAVELMADGKTYDQIAREVGYANRGTAHRLVKKALAEHLAENIEEMRRLEGDRLEALLKAHWPKAVAGDLRATRVILRIIQMEGRLYGLYDVPPVWSPMALVMSPEEAMAYELGRRDGRAEAEAEAEAAARSAQQATQGGQHEQDSASA